MKRVKEITIAALITAAIIGALFSIHKLATVEIVVAQPNPGCGFVSAVPWSPCYSLNPPQPGVFPNWTVTDGIPGTWGPNGYSPIQGKY